MSKTIKIVIATSICLSLSVGIFLYTQKQPEQKLELSALDYGATTWVGERPPAPQGPKTDKRIVFKSVVEKSAFRAMETELEALCKAKKLESCESVSVWGAFSVMERARECMEAKSKGPSIDGSEWNPDEAEYKACYKSVSHEGRAYVEANK